ncbi:MAG: hypothetical protein ACRDX8_13310 [Acidimicrobiales bacterium]
MSEPRRDCYLPPATGGEVAGAFDAAMTRLCEVHNFSTMDPPALLHELASLIAEGQARVAQAVIEARGHGLSWSQVGDCLGVTRASAWQRYSALVAESDPLISPLAARRFSI